MDEVLNYGTLGLLGVLVLSVLSGMLWGTMRGTKRTIIRIIVLIVCFSVALLITPIVSNLLLNMNIKISDGKTLRELIMTAEVGQSTIESHLQPLSNITALVNNMPLIILNVVVFIVLALIFQFVISPIFYAIIKNRVAPKRDKDGDKIPHNKFYGMLMGIVQGLVVFAFVFIPVNGLISCLNEVAVYKTSFVTTASVSATSNDFEKILDDMESYIQDANDAIQDSIYGKITKFTGMQFLSKIGMNYLWTIKAEDTSVNVKTDVVETVKLVRDVKAAYQLLNNTKDSDDLKIVFNNPANIAGFRSIVNKIFNMETIKILLQSNISEFVSAEGWLNDVDLLASGSEAEKANNKQSYIDAILTSIETFDFTALKSDFNKIIDLAEMLFADHGIDYASGGEPIISYYGGKFNLYTAIKEVIFAVSEDDSNSTKDALVETTFYDLHRTLTKVKFNSGTAQEKNLAQKMFATVADLSIFKNLLFKSENAALHNVQLSLALNMSTADATITDFDSVMNGIANIVTRLCKVGPTIVKLTKGGDIDQILDCLTDSAVVGDIGEIFEILTNEMEGTKTIIRTLLADQLGKLFKDESSAAGGISLEKFTASFTERLKSGENIHWATDLNSLRNIVDALNQLQVLDFNNVNPDDLINCLISGIVTIDGKDTSLLEMLAENELLSEIVVNIIETQINDSLCDDSGNQYIQIDFGDNSKDVIGLIGQAFDNFQNVSEDGGSVVDWISLIAEDSSFQDAQDIAALFGGTEIIQGLADAGVVINVDETQYADLQNSIKNLEDSNADLASALNNLFNFYSSGIIG